MNGRGAVRARRREGKDVKLKKRRETALDKLQA